MVFNFTVQSQLDTNQRSQNLQIKMASGYLRSCFSLSRSFYGYKEQGNTNEKTEREEKRKRKREREIAAFLQLFRFRVKDKFK